jgi:hypothetical protein
VRSLVRFHLIFSEVFTLIYLLPNSWIYIKIKCMFICVYIFSIVIYAVSVWLQVRKMEGDIKVVKKQGPGTLLRFYLVFGTPSEAEPDTPRLSLPVELENAKVYISILENHQQNSLDSLSSNYWLVSQEAVQGLTSWAGLDQAVWLSPCKS